MNAPTPAVRSLHAEFEQRVVASLREYVDRCIRFGNAIHAHELDVAREELARVAADRDALIAANAALVVELATARGAR